MTALGYSVVPVYSTSATDVYLYSNFRQKLPNGFSPDCPIELRSGDVFLGLDLSHEAVIRNSQRFKQMRESNILTAFVLYDLLPLQCPNFFNPLDTHLHEQWVNEIAKADAVVAISKTVEDEFLQYIRKLSPGVTPQTSSFPLGSAFGKLTINSGAPGPAGKMITGQSFLMVGTLEPRKGHSEVLDVFDKVWEDSQQHKLVIVGKRGWMCESLIERIETHPLLNIYLFWHSDASDEVLARCYHESTALIAASYGEGFGLPLIEAATFGIPVIARDLPIFRESGPPGTQFFSGPEELQSLISGATVKSERTVNTASTLTWNESSNLLVDSLVSLNILREEREGGRAT
jgi:glycosyltransferase involved in cell wall biosynthesis